MANQTLILHGEFLPPLLPVQEVFTSDKQEPLFSTQGTDFEDFKASLTENWAAFLKPLSTLLTRRSSEVKIAIFIPGPALLWLQKNSPKLSALLQKINKSGSVSWICGPMDHSFRFLYHRSSLSNQVMDMQEALLKIFGQRSDTIAMPGFFYNTYFGYLAKQLGAKTIIVPPHNNRLVSHVPHSPDLMLLHTENWTPQASVEKKHIWLYSLNSNRHEEFLSWFSSILGTCNWLFPGDWKQDKTISDWDVQHRVAQSAHLGRELEALEHPFCQNWMSHLKILAETDHDIPELHHAGLFEAILGYGSVQKPTEVYRTLLMRIKLASQGS